MNRRRLLLLASLALAGCAAPNIDKNFALDKATTSGVALCSITYDGDYAGYRLHIVNRTSGQTFLVEHGGGSTLNPVLAFKGEKPNKALGKPGSVFAIEMPAGKYVVRDWQITQGSANVWSTNPTEIEFEVKPGEAIYLGGFHFKETRRFVRAITAATLTLADQSSRDLPAIREQFPALASVAVTQTLEANSKVENVGGESTGTLNLGAGVPRFTSIAR